MADPKALGKLAGIEQKLADLAELGKQLKDTEDPAVFAALQLRFKSLAKAFDEQVRTIQASLTEAGLVKPPKYSLPLEPAQTAQVLAETGVSLTAVALDEPPARALTSDELLALALQQARATAAARKP